jgi:hypothetical protein
MNLHTIFSARTYIAITLVLLSAAKLSAADDITNEPIVFDDGGETAVVEGSIQGYQIIDYVLSAKRGQAMDIRLQTENTATYFNLIEPNKSDEAMFIGSILGDEFQGNAEFTGNYKVRVYMMRSAARRNEKADYQLSIFVRSDPTLF